MTATLCNPRQVARYWRCCASTCSSHNFSYNAYTCFCHNFFYNCIGSSLLGQSFVQLFTCTAVEPSRLVVAIMCQNLVKPCTCAKFSAPLCTTSEPGCDVPALTLVRSQVLVQCKHLPIKKGFALLVQQL